MVDLSQVHSSPYLSQGSVPDSPCMWKPAVRLPAAVTVLGAGDAALGPCGPYPAGLCAGLQGAHGVWQRSLQTSCGPWCGRDRMLSGSWPRRLSGQEESPKGCTGEKDQVHPDGLRGDM